VSWIILEGLDRTGKSSVAKLYKSKGFEVIHFSAPDKKYTHHDYVGPSYFEDIMDMYMQLSGKDIVFDRSIYGELVWPEIYGRDPLLSEEEVEELLAIEHNNFTQHVMLYDQNVKGHWERCVANNEPLTQDQFHKARKLFFEVADRYGFGKKTIMDFKIFPEKTGSSEEESDSKRERGAADENNTSSAGDSRQEDFSEGGKANRGHSVDPKRKLEKANAIDKVLSSRIIRNKGDIYEELESDIRLFLEDRMSDLLGEETKGLTGDEVKILKLYVQRLKKLEQEKRK
jgi:hypothetical protein